ncbi:MAG TPA: hypothetical protein VNZ52_02125 [Candidatus Thermoplasmatota archaeon]|nr:hypothetical protein [Candidatus Thermoplasmatota archaeon]
MRPGSKAKIHPRGALALAVALAAMLAGCTTATEPATTNDASDEPAAAASMENETAPGTSVADAPHLHDYWSGRERVTLIDTDFTVEPPSALLWGAQTTRFLGETAFGGAFVTLPEGAIVYEGTGRMEITVTWSEPSITGMRFLHRHAGSGEIQPWTETPNGKTVALEVTPEMTDMPHAQTSRWVFLMAASGTPAVAIGTFHVLIEIVKTRDVTEWPAHPDLWGGQPQVLIAEAEGHTEGRVAPTGIASTDPWAVPADAIPAQRLVPMGAATLRVTVTVLDLEEAIQIERLHLLARTALDVEFDFDDQGDPVEVSDDGLTWTWQRTIEMDETDNPYAEASAWAFRVVAGSAGEELPPCDYGCYEADLRYHLTAVVEKAAPEA